MNQEVNTAEMMGVMEAPPRSSARIDRTDAQWEFLQHNFLLLFPISLFTLLGIFAAVIAASP
jgi:hypothetical protein